MAKVIITVEDRPNGLVSVRAEPNFEQMIKSKISGREVTSAEGYAMSALLHIRASAKQQKSTLGLTLPKIKRPYL